MVSLPIKILAWVFIAAWAFAYAAYYPLENFLWTCNIGLILTALALAADSRLLLSAVLIVVALPDLGWVLDVASAAWTGSHLFGGTEYMFDREIPLGIRLFSFEHLLLTPFLIYSLWGRGYDSRAPAFSAPFLVALYYLTYFLADPAWNVNWVYGLFGKPQTIVAPVLYPFVAAMLFCTLLLLPSHFLAKRFIPGQRS